jgi:TRAP-type mannitol/chloroaromatic compound transport system permease small subunit
LQCRGAPLLQRSYNCRAIRRLERGQYVEAREVSNLQLVVIGITSFVVFGGVVAVFVRPLLKVSHAIDVMNTWIGRVVAWGLLAAVVISTANAIVRKVFDMSSNSWLEMQWILFGAVFLICASWTLLLNEHIRIDIVSNLLPRRVRSGIDYVGHLFFLIPMALVLIYTSAPFFYRSLLQNEQSTNAGGLPVYPSKFLVLLGSSLLLLQGLSELIKRTAIIRGVRAEDMAGGGHQEAAEAEAARLREALAEEAAKREAAAAAKT